MRKTTPFLPAFFVFLLILACADPCLAQPSAESKKMAAEYRDKGLGAQRSGDLDTALVCYQKAVELDPSLAIAYNDIGVIYESKGWNDRAKAAYGKAVDLDPSLASAYYNLGSVYEKEGDLDQAVAYFKKRVLVGDWNDEWTSRARRELKSLGVSDPEIRQDFLDQHLTNLESTDYISGTPKGNDLDPKKRKRDARWHLIRGKQLYYMGMYPEALVELGMAEVLDPRNKEIQKILEEVHRKTLMAD
jgi:tetratricopeptide (TPR) repeat protein